MTQFGFSLSPYPTQARRGTVAAATTERKSFEWLPPPLSKVGPASGRPIVTWNLTASATKKCLFLLWGGHAKSDQTLRHGI